MDNTVAGVLGGAVEELEEEQWISCARGVIWQWVTVIEITIENHSRPGVGVPLVESGA